MLEVPAGNPSTALRRSPSSRPKSRPFGAVGLETRLRAQPLAREALARSTPKVRIYQRVRRHLPHYEQRNNHQVSGTSRGEAGRAAADAYSRAIDGGTLSGYLLLCESHRRRDGGGTVGCVLG